MTEAAKRVAAELDIDNGEFRVLDAEQMELADDSVDGVLCRWGYMLMGEAARPYGRQEACRAHRAGSRCPSGRDRSATSG